MPHVNSDIKNTFRVFPEQGRYGMHRFDMNENPEGLPMDFVNSVLQEITPEFLSIYPEPNKFIKKYADFLGVESENITVTNGSDMAIRYLLEVFGEKGKEVVTVAPSFEMYWVNCCILGYKHIPVAYEEDFTIKVEKILEAINDNWNFRFGWAHLFANEGAGDTFSLGYYPKDMATFLIGYNKDKFGAAVDGFYFIRRTNPVNSDVRGWPSNKYGVYNLSMDYAPTKQMKFYLKVDGKLQVEFEHS